MQISKHYHYKTVKDIVTGDIILHPIYRKDGFLLIGRYKILTTDLIPKIKLQIPGDFFILTAASKEDLDHFIRDREYATIDYFEKLLVIANQYKGVTTLPVSIDSFIEEDLRVEVYAENIVKLEEDNRPTHYFERLLNQIPSFKSFENNLESSSSQIRAKIIKNKLIQIISEDKQLYNLFIKMKVYKDIFFIHSINTTSMALMIGLCLELDDDQLIDLALAALFADVGFIRVPKQQFNEYLKNKEVNKQVLLEHLELFMEIASETDKLRNESIIYAIMDRHEHYNGSGYPKGKKGMEISLFGRIIFICQSYDELVGGYSQDSITPRKAIDKLWQEKGIKCDPDILKLFIYRTNYYKLGQTVMTEGGLQGKIIGFEDFVHAPHIPIVSTEE